MDIGTRIKKIRKSLNLSRNDFEPNISASTLRHWESNTYEPKDKSLLELVEAFKNYGLLVSTNWLKTGIPPLPKYLNRSNSLNSILEKELIDVTENEVLGKDELLFRDIDTLKKFYGDDGYYLIVSNEMSPKFKIGDYVFGVEINLDNYSILDMEPTIVITTKGKKYFCYCSYNAERSKISFTLDHGYVQFLKSEVSKIIIILCHRRSFCVK